MRGQPGHPDAGGIVAGPEPDHDARPDDDTHVARRSCDLAGHNAVLRRPDPDARGDTRPDGSPEPRADSRPDALVVRGAGRSTRRQAGDTLWDIAHDHGVTLEVLLAANPQVTDRRVIHVGDKITVPPPGWQAPLAPVAYATIVDADLDGAGDLVVDGAVEVGFNHFYWAGELRGVYQFDLRGLPRDGPVALAHLVIRVNGTNTDGTDPHFTVFAGAGTGLPDKSDFTAGTLISALDAFASERRALFRPHRHHQPPAWGWSGPHHDRDPSEPARLNHGRHDRPERLGQREVRLPAGEAGSRDQRGHVRGRGVHGTHQQRLVLVRGGRSRRLRRARRWVCHHRHCDATGLDGAGGPPGGLPNTTYTVQLIQSAGLGGSIEDCSVLDATLITDSRGNGHATVREARFPDTIGAFVYLVHLRDATGPVDLHGTRLVPVARDS